LAKLLNHALHFIIRLDREKSFSFGSDKWVGLNKIAKPALFRSRCRAIRLSFRPEQCPSTVIVSLPLNLQFSYQGRGFPLRLNSSGQEFNFGRAG